MTRTAPAAVIRNHVAGDRLNAAWQTLRAPVVPGRLLDVYRRGVGACWLWLAISWGAGYANWNPSRPPVLWQADGVRLPWPGATWVPVWSPIPDLGLAWLLPPMALAGLWLLAAPWQARPAAAVLLFAGLWLLAADRLMFHYHRYLIAHMTLALLLLPPTRRAGRVSHLDCLPVTGLAVIMWGWSAWAKLSPDWPALWMLQLRDFGPPVVDAAISRLFASLPLVPTVLAGALLTTLAELFVAVYLCRPRYTRWARRLGLFLCAGFLLLAPPFTISVGVLTWVASRTVEAGATDFKPSANGPRNPRLRHLLATAFLALHIALPLRTYLAPGHADTHTGYFWAWRQMADLRPGRLRVETHDPARLAWHDLTPAWHAAHPHMVGHLAMSPCELPWALAWLAMQHPELTPSDQPLRLSLPPSDEAPVPAPCASDLPPHVEQVGTP